MKLSKAEKKARQEALYNFLISRGNVWTSTAECTDSINLYPAFFKGYYHNSAARRHLTEDISNINRNPKYEKIIVHSNDGIKIATEEEAIAYLKSRKKEAIKMLAAVSAIAKKISRDQQLNLQGEIAEAFLKE